jgi:hypothetical protein
MLHNRVRTWAIAPVMAMALILAGSAAAGAETTEFSPSTLTWTYGTGKQTVTAANPDWFVSTVHKDAKGKGIEDLCEDASAFLRFNYSTSIDPKVIPLRVKKHGTLQNNFCIGEQGDSYAALPAALTKLPVGTVITVTVTYEQYMGSYYQPTPPAPATLTVGVANLTAVAYAQVETASDDGKMTLYTYFTFGPGVEQGVAIGPEGDWSLTVEDPAGEVVFSDTQPSSDEQGATWKVDGLTPGTDYTATPSFEIASSSKKRFAVTNTEQKAFTTPGTAPEPTVEPTPEPDPTVTEAPPVVAEPEVPVAEQGAGIQPIVVILIIAGVLVLGLLATGIVLSARSRRANAAQAP